MPGWLQAVLQVAQPLTPVTVILGAVTLLLTGRLVPRRTVTDIRDDRDARVSDAKALAEIWREAYRVSESARVEDHELLRQALEGVHTIVHLLESRRDAVEAQRDARQVERDVR